MSRQVEQSSLAVPISAQRDHILGPVQAPVTLVEYGDFECPHCGQAHLVLKELLLEVGDVTRFVFRHFPLVQMHPHAERAAEAAEAAGAQGQFWQMHDLLFENQNALADTDLLVYAQQLGLDIPRFTRDLATAVHMQRVRDDFRDGVRSGVNGTPSFFINGRRHDGGYDLASLTAAIETEIRNHQHGRRAASGSKRR